MAPSAPLVITSGAPDGFFVSFVLLSSTSTTHIYSTALSDCTLLHPPQICKEGEVDMRTVLPCRTYGSTQDAQVHIFLNATPVSSARLPYLLLRKMGEKSLCCDTYSITGPTLAVSEISRTPIDCEKHPHPECEYRSSPAMTLDGARTPRPRPQRLH